MRGRARSRPLIGNPTPSEMEAYLGEPIMDRLLELEAAYYRQQDGSAMVA